MIRLKNIKHFNSGHKDIVKLLSAEFFTKIMTALVYGILPVVLMILYDEWRAGLFIGIIGLLQAFLVDPISGTLSDKIGARKLMIYSSISLFLAGLVWLIFPINSITLLLFTILFFMNYGFRNVDAYILRATKKEESGFIFGVFTDILAIGCFISTLLIPYFAVNQNIKLIGFMMIFFSLYGIFILLNIKDDLKKKTKINLSSFNIFLNLKNSIHFIKTNNGYPLLSLGTSIFEGLFYGVIWFVIPVHVVNSGLSGLNEGLQLGIYEVITIFIAGYTGYLADKYNWKHIHSFGWIFMILGLIALPFYSWPTSLIIIGVIIAIGNNLSNSAAKHTLGFYDNDHDEDGSFSATSKMSMNIGYGIAPILAGYFYFNYGFSPAMAVATVSCSILGLWMLYLTWKLEK